MSVWITSLVGTREVLKMLLAKYQIESDMDRFSLYVVKDNGGKDQVAGRSILILQLKLTSISERRRLLDSEYPLMTRVNLGPHEDAARIYVLDDKTVEICHEVAQFLRFSYAELRAILHMFYEEEEAEIAKVKKR